MRGHAKRTIWLIEQSGWKTPVGVPAAMPLAAGYLKAMVLADPALAGEVDIRIFSFVGHETIPEMAGRLFAECVPDALGFSVLGWNFRPFAYLIEVYRTIKPDGLVIWGGTHVSGQAERVFPKVPQVDLIVNGEGEETFRDVVRVLVGGGRSFEHVQGVSFRREAEIVTTAARPRIAVLDTIPSPLLSGALPLASADGKLLYDSVLMETNRGCPYFCAFCYWGGAIGQKVRAFSLDRLAAEIEFVARHGVSLIDLCDANFGMTRQDEEFLEICLRARERYGYPRRIFTSWAKNKGKVFHRMLGRMKDAGFNSSFNLALQTTTSSALEQMNRKNMAINDWQPLADKLISDGFDLYGELIWGCPGDTPSSFLEGYDRLASRVSQIAVYPLLIMPNTDYDTRRRELGIVTFRIPDHDFELVMSHETMTVDQNRQMHRFLFWARAIGEHLYFRYLWKPLLRLCGITQSQVLLSLDKWMDGCAEPAAAELRGLRERVVARLETNEELIERALQILYNDTGIDRMLHDWWREAMVPRLPDDLRAFMAEVFRIDLLTRPISWAAADRENVALEKSGPEYAYKLPAVPFDHDVLEACADIDAGRAPDTRSNPVCYDVFYRDGFTHDMRLFHNAHNRIYYGVPVRVGATNASKAAPRRMALHESSCVRQGA